MPSKIRKFFNKIFFGYSTPKIVRITNVWVGLTFRVIQLVILSYVIGWVIIWNKGYQQFSPINSAVTAKLKGVEKTNFTSDELSIADFPDEYNKLWDVGDYVIPPQENGAFFVLTNAIITPNQEQGVCPEANIPGAKCARDTDCTKGIALTRGHGTFTGTCNTDTSTCNVYAWCPIEKNVLPLRSRPLLRRSEDFTVLIKNSIAFPLWKIKTRNIANTFNEEYLTNCRYDVKLDPLCPIFRLGTIVDAVDEDYNDLATRGGVMAIFINWNCNLDYDVKYCLPEYEFRRLDDPNAVTGKGWNFRFAKFYDNGAKRTLYKAYGILFVVIVNGQGGKFSTIPLIMNLGSGLGLLSIGHLQNSKN